MAADYVPTPRPGAQERFHPPRTHHARELRRNFSSLLAETVRSEYLRPGERVVDLGCAGRSFEELLRGKFREYVGVDLPGNPAADLAVEPDGSVPLEDGSADCVLSTQVIEHVEDVAAYLREANRLLRPGGTLLISTNGHYRFHPDPVDLWRWTADGLRVELERANFEVRCVRSILRGPSAAVLLWQNTTMHRLPALFRPFYVWCCQGLIAAIERRSKRAFDEDAVAFLAIAEA